ncbi:MAG: GHKL domain-containing protein [Pseudoflavonifractor sp.]
MYALGHVAELVSAINMALGMAMAHTLYKSPRKVRQWMTAWGLLFVVCILIGEVLNVLLPQFTEQRLASFTGCLFVFGYLYVFPNIPLAQRVFNYFLAVDFMYIIILVARTASMLLVGYFALPSDAAFAGCYGVIAGGFWLFYKKWLRSAILRSLAAFQTNLMGLTLFSMVFYFGTLFLMDVWAPWPALTLFTALPCLGLVAMKVGGYVLAFRTLTVIGQRISAQSEAKMARMQLTLSEKEYRATMEGIDQVRRMRHDMNHHLTAIDALMAENDTAGARAYIEKAAELLPQRVLSGENPITGSFIERFRALCQEADISFSAQISYNEAPIANKAHLGILLGNALQNAYDAALLAQGEGRFLSIEGKRVHDNLIFIVKNGFSGTLDKLLKTTKGEGHGLGLSSMKNVVEEYGGYLDTKQENGVFTLSIALTLLAQAKQSKGTSEELPL